ncbi:MAG: M20/M25/M40 family metallo-hydrolase [Phycisphaera sp.]|nr:M20/M25/M40 family metallo-hydrolase [Phycisphaera sp.]
MLLQPPEKSAATTKNTGHRAFRRFIAGSREIVSYRPVYITVRHFHTASPRMGVHANLCFPSHRPHPTPTDGTMPDTVQQHLERDLPAAIERLKQFLSIPSVSTDPAYKPHIATAAKWVCDQLASMGLDAKIHSTRGHPVVLGTTPNPDPDKPTVMFYGHYDVQPADPLDKWSTPPFEPTIKPTADGKGKMLVARGSSDDKGQVACFLEALRAWHHVHGKPPVNVRVLIEGEEEMGSVNLKPFLEAQAANLKGNPKTHFVLISDTAMWDEQTVAITYSLRGLVYYDIQLHNANRDLHSGMFGGVSANPATILTQVLGKLFDENHRVTIPGFYDDVRDIDAHEKAEWDRLGFDEMKNCLQPIGVSTPFGEAGYTTLQRKWARPSCDINGLYGGYGGAGAKTVIPSFAGAKVSFRLAPDQDPRKISEAFEAWLKSQPVHGCRWKITNHGGCRPVITSRDSAFVEAAKRAIRHTTSRDAVLMREGATIPVVADFQGVLGLDSLLIGFGLSDDRLHAPDEKFNLNCFTLGCKTHARLLHELSQI